MSKRFSELTDLTGKVAVVTGGASGQGAVASRLFAEQGARVVVADIDLPGAEAVAATIGGVAVKVDVAQEHEVRAMVDLACSTFGGIDILFNNAGIGFSASSRHRMASIVETPGDAWDAILDINLKGVAMGCKHAIPRMVERGGGVVVNNASINAIAGVHGADAYTAAKGGIVSLTRVLAADWGVHGVRVNCICPGPVETPMIAALLGEEDFHKSMTGSVPMGRVGTAEEIAAVAVFLATPAAAYINGAILPVDGGWSAR